VRFISDEHAKILKDATASAVMALDGTSRAAKLLGVASSTITKYASPADEWRESFVRLDLAAEMDRLSGHSFLTSALARVVTGDPEPPTGPVTASLVLRLNGILDDVVREVAAALEDGHIDSGERLAVRRRIAVAQRKLARLDARMAGG